MSVVCVYVSRCVCFNNSSKCIPCIEICSESDSVEIISYTHILTLGARGHGAYVTIRCSLFASCSDETGCHHAGALFERTDRIHVNVG